MKTVHTLTIFVLGYCVSGLMPTALPADDKEAVAGRAGKVMEGVAQPPSALLPAPTPATPLPLEEVARRATRWSAFIESEGVYGAGITLGNGYVLTCQHVVEGRDKVRVSLMDGQSLEATVVDSDPVLDVALLRADGLLADPATVGISSALVSGERVVAAGAPRKMPFTVSSGIVSYVGRSINGIQYLQTDLPINGGNSGGPVLNQRGEVVALMSFILRGSRGLAFALPLERALERFESALTPVAPRVASGG